MQYDLLYYSSEKKFFIFVTMNQVLYNLLNFLFLVYRINPSRGSVHLNIKIECAMQ